MRFVYHRWLSIDSEEHEDQCIGCGVVAPDVADPDSGLMDHGPLPIGCPGPDVERPHHFHAGPNDTIECALCTVVIDQHTLPADVDWECPES